MKHRKNVLSAAIGAACAVMATGAAAITADQLAPSGNRVDFRISGASAQQPAMEAYLRAYACDNTVAMDRYTISTNFFVYLCKPSASLGLASTTTQLALMYSNFGGSGFGIAPVAQGVNPASGASHGFLDLSKISANLAASSTLCVSTSATAGSPTLPSYTSWACSTGGTAVSNSYLTDAAPQGGFADVEPALFVGLQVGALTVANDDPAALNTISPYFAVFGVPVTKNLRDDLQGLQIGNLISSTCTVGDETEACMPSLNRSQLSAIYTGSQQNLSFFGLAAGNLHFVNRVSTSGTRKIHDAYWTGNTCGIPGAAAIRGNTLSDTGAFAVAGTTNATRCGVTTTLLASGGGDVVNCLHRMQVAGVRGFGVLTTESKYGTGAVDTNATGTPTNSWRFLKVDGKSPTLLNAATGAYSLGGEATFNYPNGAPGKAAALAGDQLLVATSFSQLAKATNLAPVNAAFVQVYGSGGLLGFLDGGGNTANATPFTTASLDTNPVTPFTRHASGKPVNCQPPQAAGPAR